MKKAKEYDRDTVPGNYATVSTPCPNCGEINSTYFGEILTVPSNPDRNTVACPCCESKLTFDAGKRFVSVFSGGGGGVVGGRRRGVRACCVHGLHALLWQLLQGLPLLARHPAT